MSTALDAAGGASQFGVRLAFLSQLGARADWMTSYHLGLMSSAATRSEPSDLPVCQGRRTNAAGVSEPAPAGRLGVVPT